MKKSIDIILEKMIDKKLNESFINEEFDNLMREIALLELPIPTKLSSVGYSVATTKAGSKLKPIIAKLKSLLQRTTKPDQKKEILHHLAKFKSAGVTI